ncbi:MAG TPA: hypothetical protein VLB69_07000 [Rudaea sp.]|nr:hypothetical protein [Rudaea sp.]
MSAGYATRVVITTPQFAVRHHKQEIKMNHEDTKVTKKIHEDNRIPALKLARLALLAIPE